VDSEMIFYSPSMNPMEVRETSLTNA